MIYLKTGLIPLNLAYDDEIVQEANGLYQLTFKFPKSDELSHLLKEETFLLADDLHGEQEFFVFEVKKSLDHVTVYANQVSTLLNSYAIGSISVSRVHGQTVMTALAGSVVRACPFHFFSDVAGRHTLNLSHVSVMDALAKGKHSIVGQWGGDLVRDKYSVRLLANGGAENQSLFMYRKNLSQFEQERSIKDLRTRIHFRKIIKSEEAATKDQVLAVTVDSPLIGQYSQIYEATMTVEDQDVTDEASLRAYGQAYYGKTLCDLPEEGMELAVVGEPDTPVRLYDVVSVLYDDYGIDLRLKISKYRYAPMAKRLKSIGFGKVGQTPRSIVSKQVEEAKAALVDDFDHKLQKEIDNANAAFDAEFDKAKQAIEDGIEEAKAAAEVVKAEIGAEVEAVAREGQAVKRTVEAGLAEADRKAKAFESDVRSRVGQIETKTNQVADQARQSDQKADHALTRAGASEKLAQTAKDTADRAIRQAGDNLRTAQERASQLQADLDTAKRSITSQARDILNQAQAQSDLTRKVKTVEETANGTKSTLTELTKTVNANTGNLTSVTQRVATAENTLTNVRNQYSTLKTAVDEQTGKVTILERQTADLSSGLDGVKERFDSIQIGAVNLFRLHPATKGYFKGTRNNDVVGSRYAYGPKISVESGGRYLLQVWAKQANDFSWIGYNQLDADGNHIAGSYSGTYPVKTGTYFKKVITTLPNAKYIQFSFSDDIFGDDPNLKIQFEKGTIPTDYQPAEEDFRHEFAEYKRTVTENTSRLEQSIQTTDGKAESAKTLAQQTARVLELKAEKSTLDAVTGRVSSAEGTIRLQAEQIAQRLTSTQVDSLVSGKGYQTKAQVDANITGRGYITNAALAGYVPTTTFDNYKTETAQSIERGLTATRALIPTEVGGRNLVRGSAELKQGSRGWAEGHWRTSGSGGSVEYNVTLPSSPIKGVTKGVRISSTDSNQIGLCQDGQSLPPGTYTFSVWILGSNGLRPHISGAYSQESGNPFSSGNKYANLTDSNWTLVTQTFTLTKRYANISLAYLMLANPGTVYYAAPYIHASSLVGSWSPAPEDMVTSVDFNRVRETAELYERVIGRSEGDIQTNVARQVLTSQLYQTEVTKANWDSRNHIRNGSFVANGTHWNDNTDNSGVSVNYDHSKAVDNRRRSGVHIWGTPSSRFKGLYQLFSLKATTGQKVTLSALVSRDGNGPGNMEWGLHFRRGGAIVNQTWKYITPGEVKQGSYERQVWTVSLPVDVDEINVMFYLESGKASNYYLTEISFAVSDRFVGYTDSLEDNAAVSTRVSQLADSYGIKVLGNKEKILSELNLNSNGVRIAGKLIHLDGTVTASDAFFRSIMADKIEAGNIKAGAVTTAKIAAGAVTADHLLVNQAMIDKLVTNSVWADRLFAQAAFVNKLKAVEIQAGQIRAGLINTDMLAANAVTADKLLVNQALFNKLMADEAYLRQLFAKQAFITQVQSVVLSADKIMSGTIDARRISVINLNARNITSGKLRSSNGATSFDLDNGNLTFNSNATINFNSSSNAIERRRGGNTGFMKVQDSSGGGVNVMIGASSGYARDNINTGKFAGFLASRDNDYSDYASVYGDTINFRHDQYSPKMWIHTIAMKQDYNLVNILDRLIHNMQKLSKAGAFKGETHYTNFF